jgi:hypothetical protein
VLVEEAGQPLSAYGLEASVIKGCSNTHIANTNTMQQMYLGVRHLWWTLRARLYGGLFLPACFAGKARAAVCNMGGL